jgi:hypothetical protein
MIGNNNMQSATQDLIVTAGASIEEGKIRWVLNGIYEVEPAVELPDELIESIDVP